MRKKFSLVIVFAGLLTVSNAQTPPQSEPQTIAECLKAVQQYSERQADAARKAGHNPDYRAYLAQAKELAKQYAAHFKVQEVNGADLQALARLYLEADEAALARAAIKRRLTAANLSEGDRADALVIAVETMLKGSPSAEDIKLGEEYTARLDALSNAMLKQKIAAHKKLAGYYGSADDDDKILAHNAIVLKLVAQIPPEERDKYIKQNLSNYDRIATVYANRGQLDRALETLRQGKAAAANAAVFDSGIARYSLIGQRGAPLKGAYWINAAPDTKRLDLRGRVTLIQFTAHWCAPCRKSYPGMLKVHQQFKERGVDVVMSTQLYGYFAGREDLTPEEEMAANREYYLTHHQLPFKIAVEPYVDLSDRTAAAQAAQRETNYGNYFVGGVPQTVLVDKQGIVRQILIGWDSANEMRLTRLIEQLLKEQ